MRLIDDCPYLTETTHLLANTLNDFAQTHICPIANQIDEQGEIPKEIWQKLGEIGALGLTVSESDGGVGMHYIDHVVAMSIISQASASLALSYGAHTNLCINQIARHGTEAQKKRFLPKLIAGQWLGALAMSESQAGSDVVGMQLQAEDLGDAYCLNGHKMWITNGPSADVVVVYAKTDPKAEAHGISAFIVSKENEGWRPAQKLDKLGMRGSGTCELVFENCRIPKNQLLGPLNKGVQILMSGLDLERLVLAGGPLGIMNACLDTVIPYLHERKQFGRPIGEFQLMQAKLADMYTSFNAAKAYIYQMALLADQGTLNRQQAASAILFASESATKVALDAIQMLGGNGYINEYPTGRFLRDAKLYEIGGGTSEIRRMLIGRELFKASQ